MAIDGRITVDVLFHDTDGTASLKVVSLEDSTEYTTGKVAIVTGTVGTTAVTIDPLSSLDYTDASGESVLFASIERFAFNATSLSRCTESGGASLSSSGRVGVSDTVDSLVTFAIDAINGTASYTLVLYGT